MELILIALLTAIAAFIGTITGFGIATIMVPSLLLLFPLQQTLLLVGIIHWFSSAWKILLFRGGIQWKIIILFGVPGMICTFIGARLIFEVSETLLSQILGGFLIAYVGYLFLHSTLTIQPNAYAAIAGGSLSGFFSGIFGIGGEVRGAFLSIFDLPKAVYIATAGAIGLVVDITRVATYVAGGAALPAYLIWGMLAFIPVSFLGALCAKKVVDRIPQQYFRLVVAAFLLVAGIKLLLFPS